MSCEQHKSDDSVCILDLLYEDVILLIFSFLKIECRFHYCCICTNFNKILNKSIAKNRKLWIRVSCDSTTNSYGIAANMLNNDLGVILNHKNAADIVSQLILSHKILNLGLLLSVDLFILFFSFFCVSNSFFFVQK